MKNFEEYTKKLNQEERRILVMIVNRFKRRPGKKNRITNKQIVSALKKSKGIEITEPRIRKIIQFIRLNNFLPGLVATSSGYWLTNDPKELKEWIETMQEREEAIRASREAGERDLQSLLKSLEQQQIKFK